jgi:signal transduction histidine kinase
MAVVPLLIFGATTQRWGVELVTVAGQVRLTQEAAAVARELARERTAAEERLRILARFAPQDSASLSSFVTDLQGDQIRFEYLEVMDSDGGLLSRVGAAPEAVWRCGANGRTSLARVEASAARDGLRWAAAYWMGDHLDGDGSRRVTVIDPEGTILYSYACEPDLPDLPPDAGRGANPVGAASIETGDGPVQLGYASAEGAPWIAIATDPAALAAPVQRLFQTYWWFVLALALITFVAFSLILKRVTLSIEDLTKAAEQVGAGELRPWLPPPGRDEVGRLTMAFSRMTDRLRTTLELADRNGRLAVMGQLSSYLAHEIRNPLSAVKMNLQRLQRWQSKGQISERFAEPIQVSLAEVDRLSDTVSNVLELGGAQSHPAELMSLHGLVTECGTLLENQFERVGVDLHLQLEAQGDSIVGRPGQLKGAIINLMLNALDAQPEGGSLRIRSALVPHGASDGGPVIRLSFLDDGPGVPPELRDRILEPFFTTKQLGSGIGLAVASRTVRASGGDLVLEQPTSLRQGAEFVVTLPLAPAGSDVEASVSRLPPWMEAPAATRQSSL